MKRNPTFISKVFLAALLAGPVAAQDPPAAAAATPSAWDSVASHLQTGGVFYAITGLKGDAAWLGGLADLLTDSGTAGSRENADPAPRVSAVLKALGLEQLEAAGFSSTAVPDSPLLENRAMLFMPQGRTGLSEILGGPAHPLQSPGFAPAGSDFVYETDLSLGALLPFAESVLTSLDDRIKLQQFQAVLGFPMPVMGLTVGDFIRKLDTRLLMAARLEPGQTFSLPGDPRPLPAFRLVMAWDNIDFIFPLLLTYAENAASLVVEKTAETVTIRPKTPASGTPDFLRPVLCQDLKSRRILLATSQDALLECLGTPSPIADSQPFAAATAALPKEGNAFFYLSPALLETGSRLAAAAFADSSSRLPPAWKKILSRLSRDKPGPSLPLAGVQANLPDGVFLQFHSPLSWKPLLAGGSAASLGLFASLGFRTWTDMASASPGGPADLPQTAPAEEFPEAGATGNILSNLQQVQFAAQTWFLDNPQAAEVRYPDLIKAELLFRLNPLLGESYDDLVIRRSGGTLTVTTADGTPVSRDYVSGPD